MKSIIKILNKNIILITLGMIFIMSSGFIIWSGNQTKWPDESIYIGIAERLALGLGFSDDRFQPSAFRPPGYPFVLSLVYQFYESVLVAKFINVIALVITAWLLSLIVRSVTPSGQIFAPILVIAYPIFTYTSGVLVPQLVGSLMFVLVLYLLLNYPKSILAAILSGVTFGMLILTIPSFALVFICLISLLCIVNRDSKLYSFKYIASFFLATMLMVGPWTIRSSLLYDKFVFISTNAGINLLYGNSENTEYNTGVVDISKYSNTGGMNEAEVDGYYKKSAIDWVVNHPSDAAGLYLGKVANYFNYKNKLSTQSEDSFVKDALMFFTYYPLLIMAVVRCTLYRKYKFTSSELILYILYFGNAFLSAVVYSRIRYRIPFDFLLVAMVSIFIGHVRTSKLEKLS